MSSFSHSHSDSVTTQTFCGIDCLTGDFKTNDDTKIFYLDTGPSSPNNDLVIVLLPGWASSMEMMKGQICGLYNEVRCITFDYRSHGESEWTAKGASVGRLAMDLHEFLLLKNLKDDYPRQTSSNENECENDQDKNKKVILFGHSMGCCVIWKYIELFSSLGIWRLVLCDQPPVLCSRLGGTLFTKDKLDELLDKLNENDVCYLEEMYRSLFSENFSDENWKDVRTMLQKHNSNLGFLSNLLLDFAFSDYTETISRIEIPTLICSGRHCPKSMQKISQLITRPSMAEYAHFNGSKNSHFFLMEMADELNLRILAFLSRPNVHT
eukprot:g3356.t1